MEPLRFITVDPFVDLAHAHKAGMCGLPNAVTQRQFVQGQQAAADTGVVLGASVGCERLGIPLLSGGSGVACFYRAPPSGLVALVSQNFVRFVLNDSLQVIKYFISSFSFASKAASLQRD